MANSVCKGVYPYFLRSNQLSISLLILNCDQLQGCRSCQLTLINQSVPHHHPSLCQAVLQCSSLCSSPPPFYNKTYTSLIVFEFFLKLQISFIFSSHGDVEIKENAKILSNIVQLDLKLSRQTGLSHHHPLHPTTNFSKIQ